MFATFFELIIWFLTFIFPKVVKSCRFKLFTYHQIKLTLK